jgi:hypothetical protein
VNRFLLTLLIAAGLTWACTARAEPGEYFGIRVVDEASGRGVPLVRLETTDKSRYYTDGNGYIAFHEPGLMGEAVWFSVSSPGYEFPQQSFGSRGVALTATPGGQAELKIRRINIAERLYRVTGRGIYRDSILLGKRPPIAGGAINGKVMGQDSAQTAVYRGKLFWLWGDTNRPGHPLGNFFTSGATSDLPGQGGLDPAVGVRLAYFVDPKTGFAKAMAPLPRRDPLPVWLDGLLTARDDRGRERLLAHFSRAKGLEPIERGLMLYNEQSAQFEELKPVPLGTKLAPAGHPLRARVGAQEYFYFPVPYPVVRVKNDWRSLTDLALYEGFTCLKDGARYTKQDPPLDRDGAGKLVWKWRKNTQPLDPAEIEELVAAGAMRREETPFRLASADRGKPIRLHGSSVYWNDYRRKWVMIGVEAFGESVLGEVWFAEANAPEGPWVAARKIATHAKKNDNQDFYNPLQHPQLAQDGGRLVYFEGTYTNTFSGNPVPTPSYDYNQLMYRLDLSDPRLKMPACPAGLSDAGPASAPTGLK